MFQNTRVFQCKYLANVFPNCHIIVIYFTLMKKKQGQIETIIFDLGGVLMDINYYHTIDQMKTLGIVNFKTLYSQMHQQELFDDFEKGNISSFVFINKLLTFCNNEVTPNQVVRAWNQMLGDFRLDMIQFINQLSKQYNLCVLSNTNEIHIEAAMRKWHHHHSFNFDDLFEYVFLSHEIGLRKPDVEVFDFVLKKMSAIPAKTLFVDDSIQHIEAAKTLQIQTHHFLNRKDFYHLFS